MLDLGCGSGRDCYIAAALVGASGQVIGIDMTDEQLQVACDNLPAYAQALGYTPNVRFITGFIEALAGEWVHGEKKRCDSMCLTRASAAAGIEQNSIDICISNCVINLSPDKKKVLEGVFEALVEGGRLSGKYLSSMEIMADWLYRGNLFCGRVRQCSSSRVGPHAPSTVW